MSFAIVVIINKAFKLFKLVLVVIVTPVAIGDIQRTQGTLKTVYKAKNRYRHLSTMSIVSTEYICLTSLMRAKWNFPLNFRTMRKLSDLYPEYSRIRLRVQNGISRLISALCVNCLISIPEYSRIIDYSITWLSTCVTVFNTCWNFQCAVST